MTYEPREPQPHSTRVQAFDLNDALLLAQREVRRLADENARLSARLEQLERLALEDPLTGLPNRRAFEPYLESVFALARAECQPLAVVMADLDHFKRINDEFSHGVGDTVLHEVGLILGSHCRITDMAARLGGEEFGLVLPGLSGGTALDACERLRHAVETYPWTNIQPGLRVTLSLGMADDPGLMSAGALLTAADTHLYSAKHTGRNRVVGRN